MEPFGTSPDFSESSRNARLLRDAINAEFLQAVKDNAERCARANIGSFGPEGLNFPEYEPDTPPTYVRIIGIDSFDAATGTTEYAYQLLQTQNTVDTGLMFEDTTVDSEVIGFPIVSSNPDIPIDGSAVVAIQPGQGGQQFYADYPSRSEIFVEVLAFNATSRHISYQEITHDSNGSFSFKSGGYAGNETINWAIEPNNQTVSVGDRGFIRRGYCPGAARVKVDMLAAGDLPTATHCEQNITIQNAQAGNFTLSLSNQTTAAIPYNTNASVLQGQLNNLTLAPSTTVTGTTPGPFNIVFGDYTAWGPLRADITHLRTKQEWLFSKTTGGNTSINVTASGAIRWAYVDQTYDSVLPDYWSASLLSMNGTAIVDADRIWLKIINPNQSPSIQIPLMVRSEDTTITFGPGSETRPLYTFHPNFEVTEAIVLSNAAPNATFSWQSIIGGANTTHNGPISGSPAFQTGARNILEGAITLIGDRGFVLRGNSMSGRLRVDTELTTEADGVSVSQVETISLSHLTGISGTFTLWYAGTSTAGISYMETVSGMQAGVDYLLGGGVATVSGATGGPWVVTWNDYAPHELIRGNPDGLSGQSQDFVFFPATPRLFTGNVTFENGTLTLQNISIGGDNITIGGNNTTITINNQSQSGLWAYLQAKSGTPAIYSWEESYPTGANNWVDGVGRSGTLTLNPAWERNQLSTPAPGAHVWLWPAKADDPSILITGAAEDWTLTIKAGGGFFTLSVTIASNTQTTGLLDFDIDAADLQTALEGLSNVGVGNVVVTGSGWSGAPFVLDFAVPLDADGLDADTDALEAYTTYVFDYENGTGNGSIPGSPNQSYQANISGAFVGNSAFTMNTTYGVPKYGGDILLGSILMTDDYNTTMSLVRGHGLKFANGPTNRSLILNANGPAAPNLSYQFNHTSSTAANFDGTNSFAANLTYGVPAYSDLNALTLLGLDGDKVTMSISNGTGISIVGSGRTYTLNATFTGNATSSGPYGAIQISNGNGGFTSDYTYFFGNTSIGLATIYRLALINEASVATKTAYIEASTGEIRGDATSDLLPFVTVNGAWWSGAAPTNIREAIDRCAALLTLINGTGP